MELQTTISFVEENGDFNHGSLLLARRSAITSFDVEASVDSHSDPVPVGDQLLGETVTANGVFFPVLPARMESKAASTPAINDAGFAAGGCAGKGSCGLDDAGIGDEARDYRGG